MKRYFTLILLLFSATSLFAQSIGIGTSTPNANAILDIRSNNKGLLIPRLSTTARNNMTNVAKGMLLYDTTKAGFYFHDGTKWRPISEPNTDSQLHYTYPGVVPTIISMSANSTSFTGAVTGTLYDNGGETGNYASNCDGTFFIENSFYDSTILIKVEVVQMNIESPYDSLEIYPSRDYEHKLLFTGNRTGTFYFSNTDNVVFRFRSNGVNNLSGFKINWTKIARNLQTAEAAPITGWYFNTAKMAARGGANSNNNWATDSLGKFSFAFGENVVAKNDNTVAFGYNTLASGWASTVFGNSNKATGIMSFAFGYNNKAAGNCAMVFGSDNIATADFSIAAGRFCRSNGYNSTSIGIECIANASNSTAFGIGTVANSENSFVVGQFNDITATNRVFEIGIGSEDAFRSNAVTVLKNGNTGIGTTNPATLLEVNGGIKTKYSGSVIRSVTATGNATLINLPITTLPVGWDFTNTLVLVSVADGTSGIIYQTKLTSTSNIQLQFEANETGATRFNYIVFKL